jgi:hypothetical protein
MHLKIIEGKTKYMPVTKRDCRYGPASAWKLDRTNLKQFIVQLLGLRDCESDISVEIKKAHSVCK